MFRGLTGEEGSRAADAAYNLGCALYKTGSEPPAAPETAPETTDRRVSALKEAGTAFQRALRLMPDDANSRRNLAVTAALTGPTEEQAKISRLMAEHGKTPPGALADMMLLQQRKLISDIPSAFTNTTSALIDSLEALAAEQDRTADLMIPLKGKLLQSLNEAQSSGAISNAPQQAAQVNGFAETIRDQLSGTATSLRDLDRAAYPAATKAEASLYTLWKLVADYGQLMREDLLRQTNTISLTVPNLLNPTDTTRNAVRDEQSEALDLTGRFQERFEKSVPPEGITRPVQQASTNEPSASDAGTNTTAGTNATEIVLSKEDRQKIVTLTKQTVATQTDALDTIDTNLSGSLTRQRKAYALLKEIEALLPKDKNQQQQQNQQKQDQQKQDDKQQQQPPKSQEQPKEQPKKQQQPQEPKKGQMSPEDLKRLLDKAKQREKEHDQEVRERNVASPMSPTERDW